MLAIILFSSTVIFSCIFLNKFVSRLGMPALIVFMTLGILFGSDGIFKIDFEDFELTSRLCSLGLLFIIFYGGFCTKRPNSNNTILKAGLLSSFGTLLTALLVCGFCFYVLKFSIQESFLLGAILSSTDAASVFSILRSKRLNLKYESASILEIESGSNDPFAYLLTIVGLAIYKGGTLASLSLVFVFQILFGILFGVFVARFCLFVLNKTNLVSEAYETLFVIALALFSYSAPEMLGGNGYLSVYITGFILGNSLIKNKSSLLYFFNGVTGLCQIVIFFLIGFLSSPHKLAEVFFPTASLFLFLSFAARPFVVFLIMSFFGARFNQMAFISLAGLRGAASIVFAFLAMSYNLSFENDFFHIVFFVCFFSVLVLGFTLPFFARKLRMIDAYSDVLKTFNDYQNERNIALFKIWIKNGHPFANRRLEEIDGENGFDVLLIHRNGCKVIPKRGTVILPNDLILIGSNVEKSSFDIKLRELDVFHSHEWVNKRVGEIAPEKNYVIALIKRAGKSFVPNDRTKIHAGDTIVFYVI